MKILIISYEFPPKIGGAGAVAALYAELISARGHEVTVITRSGESSEDRGYRLNKISGFLWPLSMILAAKRIKPDVVILNDPSAIFAAGLFADRQFLGRCISFLHGGELERIFLSQNFKRRIICFRRIYFRALSRCRLVVFPSYYFKNAICQELMSIRAVCKSLRDVLHNGKVIYAPVPASYYEVSSRREKVEEPIFDEVLTVSRLVKRKGYERMIRVFSEAVKRNDRLRWTIVGDGPYRSEIECLLIEYGLGSKVSLVGPISRDRLVQYYQRASVFMLLSEFKESYGLVYIEALSQGCPVMTLDDGGPGEIVPSELGLKSNDWLEHVEYLAEFKYRRVKAEDCVMYAHAFHPEHAGDKIESQLIR